MGDPPQKKADGRGLAALPWRWGRLGVRGRRVGLPGRPGFLLFLLFLPKNMREDRKRKCFVWGCQPGPGALTHLPPAAPAGQWLAPLGQLGQLLRPGLRVTPTSAAGIFVVTCRGWGGCVGVWGVSWGLLEAPAWAQDPLAFLPPSWGGRCPPPRHPTRLQAGSSLGVLSRAAGGEAYGAFGWLA